ncbi:hypothetical protein PHLGIDRAFT_370693 [Phlebiopsis gigantea 11061_1 CR5-6]|uniref:Uncharacterized protein n=1 Tax=Phlebiopsis gigantea (strain 11061_1 CR5-6) TaxID=745531 RepID=A0A0C3S722_PHLG1|nr:hypothetical protein PHLGIDRAFT_370693 [Phlebiopsis gigantea 11061_1 CR5-6]
MAQTNIGISSSSSYDDEVNNYTPTHLDTTHYRNKKYRYKLMVSFKCKRFRFYRLSSKLWFSGEVVIFYSPPSSSVSLYLFITLVFNPHAHRLF